MFDCYVTFFSSILGTLVCIELSIYSDLIHGRNAKGFSLFSMWGGGGGGGGGGATQKLVGSKCQYQNNNSAESTSSGTHSTQSANENTNSEILNALNAVSYRLSAIEQRIDRTEEQLQSRPAVAADASGATDVSTSSSQEVGEISDAGDDAVIPSAQFLKKPKHIQAAVDERLQT